MVTAMDDILNDILGNVGDNEALEAKREADAYARQVKDLQKKLFVQGQEDELIVRGLEDQTNEAAAKESIAAFDEAIQTHTDLSRNKKMLMNKHADGNIAYIELLQRQLEERDAANEKQSAITSRIDGYERELNLDVLTDAYDSMPPHVRGRLPSVEKIKKDAENESSPVNVGLYSVSTQHTDKGEKDVEYGDVVETTAMVAVPNSTDARVATVPEALEINLTDTSDLPSSKWVKRNGEFSMKQTTGTVGDKKMMEFCEFLLLHGNDFNNLVAEYVNSPAYKAWKAHVDENEQDFETTSMVIRARSENCNAPASVIRSAAACFSEGDKFVRTLANDDRSTTNSPPITKDMRRAFASAAREIARIHTK